MTHWPFAQQTVNIVCFDATAMLDDLLTDPQITIDDHLFWNGDPELAPPEKFVCLNDVPGDPARSVCHLP